MYQELGISHNVVDIVNKCEQKCQEEFKKIDEKCSMNSLKVLNAFHKNNVQESCFNETTGYGYNDLGRDTIEKVFSDVLGSEDALVRNQFISGSHALNVCFFALLRPNDLLLSISGTPYDTLDKLIGMELVEKRAPINAENNRKKIGYYIIDNLSSFYYLVHNQSSSKMQDLH